MRKEFITDTGRIIVKKGDSYYRQEGGQLKDRMSPQQLHSTLARNDERMHDLRLKAKEAPHAVDMFWENSK